MTCLDLKKLLPHRKVWRVLTNKLLFKLHTLRRSKPNKKSKNQYSYKASKKLGWPSLSIQPKRFKKKTPVRHKNHRSCYQKRAPPVFVDQLFIEPMKEEHHALPPKGTSSLKKCGIVDQESSVHDDHNVVSADDVWESMVLASPQMQEINERADEFIARFRAEMHHQELLARRT